MPGHRIPSDRQGDFATFGLSVPRKSGNYLASNPSYAVVGDQTPGVRSRCGQLLVICASGWFKSGVLGYGSPYCF
jgi:hypothetical protein